MADDDKDTVFTLKTILNDEGHDVMPLYSGLQVLNAISGFRPDVLILDIAMPDMSGLELARRIRTDFEHVHPLLIAISGVYGNEGPDRIVSGLAGFHHHLVKPCDPAELLALIAPLANP